MGGRWRGFRRTLYKPFGVNEISSVEHGPAFFDNERGLAMMEYRGSEQADAGMMVFLVVPVKIVAGVVAGIFDGAKAIRVLGSVLHGFELAFRVRVVVGDVGPAVVW